MKIRAKRRLYHIARRFYLITTFFILSSCSNTTNDLARNQAVENAFFAQQYNEVVQLLTPDSNNLSPNSKYFLAKSLIALKKVDTPSQPIKLLNEAAKEGLSEAAWELARIYDEGLLGNKDTLKALDWYRYHANLTSNIKQEPQFFSPTGEKITSLKMIEMLSSNARSGDQDAQIQLAKLYGEGTLVDLNLHTSLQWYLMAANEGNSHGALMTGYYYCRGLGVDRNLTTANKWLHKFDENLTCE